MAEDKKAQGNEALKSGNFFRAVELYTQAIGLDDSNAVYHTNRGNAYLRLERYNDAVKDAETACRLDKSYVKAWSLKGTALLHLSKKDEARAAYQEGLALDPSNSTLQKNLALLDSNSAGTGSGAGVGAPSTPTSSAPTSTTASGNAVHSQSLFAFLFTGKGAMLNTANAAVRIGALLMTFLYIFTWGGAAFRNALICILLSNILALYRSYGTPKLNVEYAQRVMPDRMFFVVMCCGVFMTLARPMFLVLLVLIAVDLFCLAEFIYGLTVALSSSLGNALASSVMGLFPASIAGPDFASKSYLSKRAAVYQAIISWASQMEIAIGLSLLISMNIMGLIVYFQISKVRYLTSRDSQQAWTRLDQWCQSKTASPSCPGLVAIIYHKARSALMWLGAPPTPPAAAAGGAGAGAGGGLGGMMSKCSIM